MNKKGGIVNMMAMPMWKQMPQKKKSFRKTGWNSRKEDQISIRIV